VFEIWRRDNAVCHLCGLYVKLEDASRDHVVARHYEGRTTWDNIKLAHKKCNSRRGHMHVKEYIDMWERLLEEREKEDE
jgi:5-methylcytosine-specific restriction endonuclease McrA